MYISPYIYIVAVTICFNLIYKLDRSSLTSLSIIILIINLDTNNLRYDIIVISNFNHIRIN